MFIKRDLGVQSQFSTLQQQDRPPKKCVQTYWRIMGERNDTEKTQTLPDSQGDIRNYA